MITGALKSKVDNIWNTMWSGGISNPLSVIEQLTYLLFIKRLDELHTLKERKAARTGKPIEDPIFTAKQDKLRWSRFREAAPEQMFETMRDGVFSFIKTLGQKGEADGEGGSTYSHHMKDALFMMPTARVLANVVDQLDGIDMADSDTKGDLYEYMLGKIATAGQNGQFRTPRHIIRLMVIMTAPTPKDVICDPACGTAGFLVAASEHLVEHHSDTIYKNATARRHFNEDTFHGYDFDNTMLRIGSMNMLLHGVENPDIRYKDSLAQTDDDDAEKYSLVLANPPFAGSLDYESTAKDLQQVVKTKKTELLFLALFLRLLQTGGRAAVIVPDGVLFGSSKAHRTLRKILVEEQKLDAIVSMPSGVFRPYAGVSTAILLFTKTNSGGTDDVWFYDMQADGYSLDDKRTPQPEKSDLADILARWQNREAERKRPRTDQSFLVPKGEIAGNDYDLSINRYKEVEYEAVEYDRPQVILDRLAKLEEEIAKGREGVGGAVEVSVYPSSALSEVCNISMGQAPNGTSYNTAERGYPLIAGAGDFGDLAPVPTKYTDAPTKLSQPGDIVLCIRATIGDRNWSDKEYCLGRGVAGLRARKVALSQAYLWHWLDHAAPVLSAKGRGATFLQVSKADIASLQIPSRRSPSRSGLRGFWMRRTPCGPSAARPSPSSTPSSNPPSSTCSATPSPIQWGGMTST